MTTAHTLIHEYFGPLTDLPCWHTTSEFGSWLSLRFGQPRLDIREGNPDAKSDRLKRRRVDVEGDFLLWIEMGAWELVENQERLFHSEQPRASLRRAAARLEGQKVSGVEILTAPFCTVFKFDLGSTLHVRPAEDAEPDEPLWHLYTRDHCLSLLANGRFQYGLFVSRRLRHTAARAISYAAQQVAQPRSLRSLDAAR